jgi:hypothetical protein
LNRMEPFAGLICPRFLTPAELQQVTFGSARCVKMVVKLAKAANAPR